MLLRDFRRPCPRCTDRYYPPLSAHLGPTHGPWRSKKPLPCYFHDPPPDGTHPATPMTPPDRGLLMAEASIWIQRPAPGRRDDRRPTGRAPSSGTSAQHDWDVRHSRGARRPTLGADKRYDATALMAHLRALKVTAACTSGGTGGAGVNPGVHFAAQSIAQFLNDPRLVPNPVADLLPSRPARRPQHDARSLELPADGKFRMVDKPKQYCAGRHPVRSTVTRGGGAQPLRAAIAACRFARGRWWNIRSHVAWRSQGFANAARPMSSSGLLRYSCGHREGTTTV
jgi:hypothetical protein